MLRFRYAALGAVVMVVMWLAWLGYSVGWQAGPLYESVGEAAFSWRLAGISAASYAQAAEVYRGQLLTSRESGDKPVEKVALGNVVRARMIAARILLAAGRPNAAVAFAEQARRADMTDISAAALLWRVRYELGMTAEAKRELILLGMDNPAPEILATAGETFLAEGKSEQAMQFARRSLQQNSRLAEAWLLAARIYAADGEVQSALAAAAKAQECAALQPAIRHQAEQLWRRLQLDPGTSAGMHQRTEYWLRLAASWAGDHVVFLMALAGYLLALFFPSLAGLLRSSEEHGHSVRMEA
jgi:tetratricopeptide (TPR) repeat protein